MKLKGMNSFVIIILVVLLVGILSQMIYSLTLKNDEFYNGEYYEVKPDAYGINTIVPTAAGEHHLLLAKFQIAAFFFFYSLFLIILILSIRKYDSKYYSFINSKDDREIKKAKIWFIIKIVFSILFLFAAHFFLFLGNLRFI